MVQRFQDILRSQQIVLDDSPEGKLFQTIVNSPEFERLSGVKQISYSKKAYRQGSHTRDIHSLGVYFLADQILQQIEEKHPKTYDPYQALIVRVRALIHDIGHGPCSHSWEGVMSTLGHTKGHEEWGHEIISDGNSVIGRALRDYDPALYDDVRNAFLREEPESFWDTIISSQLDADRFDFLLRDTQNSGIRVGVNESYLIPNIQLVYAGEDNDVCLAFSSKAEVAVKQVLDSREALYRSVSYHKHSESSDALLRRVFGDLQEVFHAHDVRDLGFSDDDVVVRIIQAETDQVTVADYLYLDDSELDSFIKKVSVNTHPALRNVAGYAKLLQESKPLIAVDLIMDLPGVLRNESDLKRVQGIFQDVAAENDLSFSGSFVKVKPSYKDTDNPYEKIWLVRPDGGIEELVDRVGALGAIYAGCVFSESPEVMVEFKRRVANDPEFNSKHGSSVFATSTGAVPAPQMI